MFAFAHSVTNMSKCQCRVTLLQVHLRCPHEGVRPHSFYVCEHARFCFARALKVHVSSIEYMQRLLHVRGREKRERVCEREGLIEKRRREEEERMVAEKEKCQAPSLSPEK